MPSLQCKSAKNAQHFLWQSRLSFQSVQRPTTVRAGGGYDSPILIVLLFDSALIPGTFKSLLLHGVRRAADMLKGPSSAVPAPTQICAQHGVPKRAALAHQVRALSQCGLFVRYGRLPSGQKAFSIHSRSFWVQQGVVDVLEALDSTDGPTWQWQFD
jgi:hypothetical protein